MLIPTFPNYATLSTSEDDVLIRKFRSATERLVQGTGTLTLEEVNAINVDVNRSIKYQQEPPDRDHWQSPQESCSLGHGDCEDIALVKYSILKGKGIPKERMMMVIGHIEVGLMKEGQPHAFLTADLFSDNDWLVLDNKFNHLITPEKYLNFTPLKGVNTNGTVLYARQFAINDQMKLI